MQNLSIHPGRAKAYAAGQKYPKDTSKPCQNRPRYMKRVAAYDARMRDYQLTLERLDKGINPLCFRKPGSWKP